MTLLNSTLQGLDAHGAVTLPGRASEPLSRWLRTRSRAIRVAFGVGGAGVLLIVLGVLLRNVGLWALLIIVGALPTVLGTLVGLILIATGRLWADRIRAEELPVRLDASGVSLRGIGPIPWADLRVPEHRWVPVKNDIGGQCTVMPLTPQAQARVSAQPGHWQVRVGPKPYLRLVPPFLLLPGVEGLSEDEVVHLFRFAHSRFSSRFHR